MSLDASSCCSSLKQRFVYQRKSGKRGSSLSKEGTQGKINQPLVIGCEVSSCLPHWEQVFKFQGNSVDHICNEGHPKLQRLLKFGDKVISFNLSFLYEWRTCLILSIPSSPTSPGSTVICESAVGICLDSAGAGLQGQGPDRGLREASLLQSCWYLSSSTIRGFIISSKPI